MPSICLPGTHRMRSIPIERVLLGHCRADVRYDCR
jgi:hypothetical protein